MTEDSEVDTEYSASIGKMARVLLAMAKQVILEQCESEMKTDLIYRMSLRQVQEHGAYYQVAHGQQGDTAKKPLGGSRLKPTISAHCKSISVGYAEKKLESLPKERRGRDCVEHRDRLCVVRSSVCNVSKQ